MFFVEAPEPQQAFCEAYEFSSDILRKDPKAFAMQWQVPPAAPKKGRWQAITSDDGEVHTGRFIAHGLPSASSVQVRVLDDGDPSDWLTVQTLEVPDPITDVHLCDPFGKRLGGISNLCDGWLLNESQASQFKYSTRCMRCGCESRRHSAIPDADDDPPMASQSAQSGTSASSTAQPKAVVKSKAVAKSKTPKVAASWSLLPDSTLPVPEVVSVYCQSVLLESDVLAASPSEFTVEWTLDVNDDDPRAVQQAAWESTPYRNTAGQFYVDSLPAGESLSLRIKCQGHASAWIVVEDLS